jgi:hypothetical protein
MMKKVLTIVLLGAAAVTTYVVTVQVSALLERQREERNQERLQNEMDQTIRMTLGGANQMETSARAPANGSQDHQPTLQSLVAAAHTIVLCEHRVRWGRIRCRVTQILRLSPHASAGVAVGDPILHHQDKVESNERPGEGMVTFLCSPRLSASHGFAIHDGRIMDYDFHALTSSGEPYLRGEWTVAEVIEMIETANKTGGR